MARRVGDGAPVSARPLTNRGMIPTNPGVIAEPTGRLMSRNVRRRTYDCQPSSRPTAVRESGRTVVDHELRLEDSE